MSTPAPSSSHPAPGAWRFAPRSALGTLPMRKSCLPSAGERSAPQYLDFSPSALPLPYDGQLDLLKGAVNRLYAFSPELRRKLPLQGVRIAAWSDVPRQSGLGGSSLLVTLTLAALRQLLRPRSAPAQRLHPLRADPERRSPRAGHHLRLCRPLRAALRRSRLPGLPRQAAPGADPAASRWSLTSAWTPTSSACPWWPSPPACSTTPATCTVACAHATCRNSTPGTLQRRRAPAPGAHHAVHLRDRLARQDRPARRRPRSLRRLDEPQPLPDRRNDDPLRLRPMAPDGQTTSSSRSPWRTAPWAPSSPARAAAARSSPWSTPAKKTGWHKPGSKPLQQAGLTDARIFQPLISPQGLLIEQLSDQ